MDRVITYNYNLTVPMRISAYLKSKGYTSHLLTRLRQDEESLQLEHASCAGYVHMNRQLNPGDRLTVSIREYEHSDIQPSELPLDIIYEDEDLLVVNKPAGMPIHPSIEHYEDTLANAVTGYYASQGRSVVYRCMTRLDRDTSGLVMVALNPLSAAIMSEQVRQRELHKIYIALANGDTGKCGRIEAPIARKTDSVIERIIDNSGQMAITNYRQLGLYELITGGPEQLISGQSDNKISMLELKLETGRTHQIRVHMRHIGHPLLGDFLYNPEDRLMDRQALHCASMDYVHPIQGISMHHEAPVPVDFQAILEKNIKIL